MAKPVRRAKVSAEMRAGRAAGRVFEATIANVREHAPAAMLGDVDGIHDMRVAVKRLREAMRLFRRLLPTRRRERMMPVVEILNDTLGEVRERDVLIRDAQQLRGELEDDGELTSTATEAWRTERAEAFEHLLRTWAKMTGDGFFDALEEIARRTRKRGRMVNRLDYEQFAYAEIIRALERVRERLGPALESTEPAPLHRLRIGVKRLKYAMEPFRRIFPLMREPYSVVSEAQQILGLAHDLDVLRERLAEHLDCIPGDGRAAAGATLEVLDRRRGERYMVAREVIRAFADPEFERALRDAID